MLVVEDNFLTEEELTVIQNEVLGDNFPWYRFGQAVHKNSHPFMGHAIVNVGQDPLEYRINSDWWDFFAPIVSRVMVSNGLAQYPIVNRMCLNDTFCWSDDHTGIHTDHVFSHYNILLYLTDSSGDTIIYKGDDELQRITPSQGRVVLWDGQEYMHAQQPKQSEHDRRVVLVTTVTERATNEDR